MLREPLFPNACCAAFETSSETIIPSRQDRSASISTVCVDRTSSVRIVFVCHLSADSTGPDMAEFSTRFRLAIG
jgi:hypothetical protein